MFCVLDMDTVVLWPDVVGVTSVVKNVVRSVENIVESCVVGVFPTLVSSLP